MYTGELLLVAQEVGVLVYIAPDQNYRICLAQFWRSVIYSLP